MSLRKMEAKKILIISLSGAGDVLMSTPLLRELRQRWPKARKDVLVMQGKITKDLFKNNKDVNRIIYFNFLKEGILKSLRFCNKLRKERYDLAINTYPQARLHYSLVSWLINAKKRIGFNYDSQKFKLNRLFFTDTISENFAEHVVENNLKVLEVLGLERKARKPKLILNLSKEERDFANKFFRKNKIKRAVVIHAGSGTTKNFILKRWDKKKFAELCKRVNKKDKLKIILVGGNDEEELRREIIEKSGLKEGKEIFNLEEDINKTAAVIKKSEAVIANDTIIGHVAAALGTKVIGIFGPTSWEHTGPFTKRKEMICKRPSDVKPYQHGSKGINKKQAHSLNKISVEDVYNAFKKLMGKFED